MDAARADTYQSCSQPNGQAPFHTVTQSTGQRATDMRQKLEKEGTSFRNNEGKRTLSSSPVIKWTTISDATNRILTADYMEGKSGMLGQFHGHCKYEDQFVGKYSDQLGRKHH